MSAIPPAAALGAVLVLQEDRGADAMLQALVRLGAIVIDHEREAIRPGLAVPRELVEREVARALGRRSLSRGLTWTCMVCERERPDALISVAHRPVRGMEDAFPATRVNVRFCNDSTACRRAAETADRWSAA